MRFAQFVIGPAGCGKTNYCRVVQEYGRLVNRYFKVINLDPDNANYDYEAFYDITTIINHTDLKEAQVNYGPNGSQIFCMEYLSKNLGLLISELLDSDEDYFLFDCPGQLELYTIYPIIKKIINTLKSQCDFNIATVYVMDWKFMTTTKSYFSCMQAAIATTFNLECPHVNVMTKIDMLSKRNKRKLEEIEKLSFEEILFRYPVTGSSGYQRQIKKFAETVEDSGMNGFNLFDQSEKESIQQQLHLLDSMLQYWEGRDVNSRLNDEDKEME